MTALARAGSGLPVGPVWPVWPSPPAPLASPTPTTRSARTIDEVLADARSRLVRLTPGQARRAYLESGAVLVDTRPAAQRAEGELPEAVVVDRNVLEWRFDPACEARLPYAAYDLQVILFCQQGYSSSLAAASLQDLGIWRATDVIGGYDAWREAGFADRLPH